jgi:hypothetical protein
MAWHAYGPWYPVEESVQGPVQYFPARCLTGSATPSTDTLQRHKLLDVGCPSRFYDYITLLHAKS